MAFLPRERRFDPSFPLFACILAGPAPSFASILLMTPTGDLGTLLIDIGDARREYALFQMADRSVARRQPLLLPGFVLHTVRIHGFVNKDIAYQAIGRAAAKLLKEYQLLTRVNVRLAADRRSVAEFVGYNVQYPPSGAATASLAAALVGG